jgi:peptidyl-prolyl cis-trans isomerase SurA
MVVRGVVFALASGTLIGLLGCKPTTDRAGIVASVDGRNIYRKDVDLWFRNQVAGSDQQPAGDQVIALRLNILRQLIDDEILMRRAEKLGILTTDDEVDRKLSEIKSPFTNEEFQKRLKNKNVSLDDFRQDIHRSLTIDKVMNKEITSRITISDEEITSYYDNHKGEFNLFEPRYHLARILVTGVPDPQVRNLRNDKAQDEHDVRKKIQLIENRLDGGDDFAALAMNYSEDSDTASSGGDLGFQPESALKGDTGNVVLKMKPGQYSSALPIMNSKNQQVFGFQIVKLIGKEPAGQRQLSDPRVQEAIRSRLRNSREQLLKAAYYEVLRDQAKVQNYYAQQILDRNVVAQ